MDRVRLKDWAKQALNRSYWKSVLVAWILASVLSMTTYSSSISSNVSSAFSELDYDNMNEEAAMTMAIVALVVLGIGMLFSLGSFLIKIFLINPLTVGCQRYFCVGLYQNNPNLNEMGVGFKKNYKNVIKTLFIKDLFLYLWLLLSTLIALIFVLLSVFGIAFLFVEIMGEGPFTFGMGVAIVGCVFIVVILMNVCQFPYYIKYYEYLLVPYILADNPDMPRKQAFALSKQMMMGDKWNAFVLQLSFIGWYLLSFCTCGILSIFYVEPYRNYTFAAFYKTMQQKVDMSVFMPPQIPPMNYGQMMPMNQMPQQMPPMNSVPPQYQQANPQQTWQPPYNNM